MRSIMYQKTYSVKITPYNLPFFLLIFIFSNYILCISPRLVKEAHKKAYKTKILFTKSIKHQSKFLKKIIQYDENFFITYDSLIKKKKKLTILQKSILERKNFIPFHYYNNYLLTILRQLMTINDLRIKNLSLKLYEKNSHLATLKDKKAQKYIYKIKNILEACICDSLVEKDDLIRFYYNLRNMH